MIDHFLREAFKKEASNTLVIAGFDLKQNLIFSEGFCFDGEDLYGVFESHKVLFDLASLTKLFTNFSFALDQVVIDPNYFNEIELSLLNHEAGLVAHEILDPKTWKDDLLKRSLKLGSPVIYSDLSSLRFMLEMNQKKLFPQNVDMMYWHEVPESMYPLCVKASSSEEKNSIRVHDDNAFHLKSKLSHAGLFAHSEMILDKVKQWLAQLEKIDLELYRGKRFLLGADQAQGEKSLAGTDEKNIFGHLGFTGTSVWFSPRRQQCLLILTNWTRYHMHFERPILNLFRREMGQLFWSNPLSFLKKIRDTKVKKMVSYNEFTKR